MMPAFVIALLAVSVLGMAVSLLAIFGTARKGRQISAWIKTYFGWKKALLHADPDAYFRVRHHDCIEDTFGMSLERLYARWWMWNLRHEVVDHAVWNAAHEAETSA